MSDVHAEGPPVAEELFRALQRLRKLDDELAAKTLLLAQLDESLRRLVDQLEGLRRRVQVEL